MKFILAISLFCCSTISVNAQTDVDLLIIGGNVFRTDAGTFEPNSGLAIKDGRFLNTKADPKDFRPLKTIELADNQYILPGLIDCHAHYNVRLIKQRREEFTFMPLLYLANGATVTFSCGEFDPEGMFDLRKRIESGEQVGPRLITSGPYFGRARPGWRGIKPESEIRDEVDFWAKRDVGGFKAKAIDPDSLRILIDQAHKHELTVTGHLDSGYRNSVNPRDAITMGIDRIEHFIGGDAMPDSQSAYQSLQNIRAGTPEFKQAVQQFVDNGIYFDATLTAYGYLGETTPETHEEYEYWINEQQFFTPYMRELVQSRPPMKGMEIYQRIYRAKQKTISAFHQAGGIITLGTDHVSNGNHLPGFGVHRELDALVRNGIPAADAIKIATINGARALGIDKDHGSIENGKVGDVVIIDGDPITRIRNTRNVQTVVRAGITYDPQALLDSVKGRLGPRNKDEESDW